MRLCFFGAYDPEYPRNVIIRKGLKANGVEISECWLPPKYKFWLRYPLLFLRSRHCLFSHDLFFVPEFCQKDVPLAKFLSFLGRSRVVFDPLAPRYETKILDWKRKPPDSWQAKWNFRIDTWAFRFSDLVLADTHIHKEYYCQEYGLTAEKVEVLPVGFDDDLFHPSSSGMAKERKDPFRVLFFGSFLPLHGVEMIIRSAKILSREDPSVTFRFIGSGQTLPKAEALASDFGLTNIFFENWLPQTALPAKITGADVCLGIFGEGEKAKRVIPHKVFQAMGMGKPVITLRTPAVEEVFSHRENIYFCPNTEPSSLAQAILELKKDPDLNATIAQGGYHLVNQSFSPDAIGRSLLNILEKHFNSSSGRDFR